MSVALAYLSESAIRLIVYRQHTVVCRRRVCNERQVWFLPLVDKRVVYYRPRSLNLFSRLVRGDKCPFAFHAGACVCYYSDKQVYSKCKHSLTFRVRAMLSTCHSNETRAPIANLPNSAQLQGTPTIPTSYIRVRAVAWACGAGQTHRQTDTQTRVTNIRLTRNVRRLFGERNNAVERRTLR